VIFGRSRVTRTHIFELGRVSHVFVTYIVTGAI